MTDAPGRVEICGPGRFVPGFVIDLGGVYSAGRGAYASARVSLANVATSITKR